MKLCNARALDHSGSSSSSFSAFNRPEYIKTQRNSRRRRLELPIKNNVRKHPVSLLARHPTAGREGRVAGTRELVVSGTPFLVAYRIEKNEVRILTVLHAAREWPEEL